MIQHLFTLLCWSTLQLLPKVFFFISCFFFLLCCFTLCSINTFSFIFSKLYFHSASTSCPFMSTTLHISSTLPSFSSSTLIFHLFFPCTSSTFFPTAAPLLSPSSPIFTSFATSSPSLASPCYTALSQEQMKTLGVLPHPGFLLAFFTKPQDVRQPFITAAELNHVARKY